MAGARGIVVTADAAATQAGIDMLRAGGNAADAAASAAFVLAVVEPFSSGIGGGGFATLKFGPTLKFVDFREVAPKRARRDMFMVDGQGDPLLSRNGILSVAVPGAVAGYLDLQERFGVLTRQQVMAPAIQAAQEGFAVTELYRQRAHWRRKVLRSDPEASRTFLVPDEHGIFQAPPLGYLLKQPDLARTLKLIAAEGAVAFYRGVIAEQLVRDMQSRGGIIGMADLKLTKFAIGNHSWEVIVATPSRPRRRHPLGDRLLTILNVMETLPENLPWRSPQALHVYLEASKRAFADRALLGDPLYVPYMNQLIPALIAKDRAAVLAQVITASQSEPARRFCRVKAPSCP
ncbi:MAG: gamma-glutamyltransferase [Myxococcota bacterium]